MPETSWLEETSPAFRLMIATSWLAPASWQDQQERAIREAIGADPDWAEYVRLVDRHRTPALSWAALKRVPELKIPEPVKLELQKRSDACRMQAVRHSLILAEVLKAFNCAAIPAMPLKGPILSFDLYGDVGLRQSHDLDMAVAPEDIARAQVCLENNGWHMGFDYFSLSPRQLESCLLHEHHLGFVQPQGGCLLELHWRDLSDTPHQTTARWTMSIPSVWQGCAYQAMYPITQVLYLCNHGGRHSWFRAKWLGDMARIHAQGQINWVQALSDAQRTKQETFLLASIRLLEQVYGLPMPNLPETARDYMPSLLIDNPLRALKAFEEPDKRSGLTSFRDGFRMLRYIWLTHPQKNWWNRLAELAYLREDFKVLRLPDSLFWAYAPLRPILWLWRRVLRDRPAGES